MTASVPISDEHVQWLGLKPDTPTSWFQMFWLDDKGVEQRVLLLAKHDSDIAKKVTENGKLKIDTIHWTAAGWLSDAKPAAGTVDDKHAEELK